MTVFSYMNSHKDNVGSVMFAERISRHHEELAIDALKLVSPLDITSWNLTAPGLGCTPRVSEVTLIWTSPVQISPKGWLESHLVMIFLYTS